MAKDLNFMKILKALERIHKAHPDMRFGTVLQMAMDRKMYQHNANVANESSKKILSAIEAEETYIKVHKIKKGEKKK